MQKPLVQHAAPPPVDTGLKSQAAEYNAAKGVPPKSRKCRLCAFGAAVISVGYGVNMLLRNSKMCAIAECSERLGPTYCDGWTCKCQIGYEWSTQGQSTLGAAFDQNQCIIADTKFNAKVWPVDADHAVFPGNHGDVTTALCFSGGGARSFGLSVGAMRALHHLDLMKNVDAISAVSGGAWAAGAYMFAKDISEEDLIGSSTTPDRLTMANLEKHDGKLGTIMTTKMKYFVEGFLPGPQHRHHYRLYDDLWEDFIADTILQPMGLHNYSQFMAGSLDDVDNIKKANPDVSWDGFEFITPQLGRPKVLVLSAAIIAPCTAIANDGRPTHCYKDSKNSIYTLQMSPDYTGSPFHPGGGRVDYDPELNPLRGSGSLKNVLVGGGFVQSFAFGGKPPHDTSGLGTDGSVGKLTPMETPHRPFNLAQALAFSSCALAETMNHIGVANFIPKARLWAVGGNNTDSYVYQLGDGGNIENAGLLPMLQRHVTRIVWLINTDTGIDVTVDFCNTKQFTTNEYKGKVTNQITDKFGFGVDSITGTLSDNQVFAREEFNPLLCKLKKQKKAGTATIVSQHMTVQENKYWQIKGYDIEIIFLYHETCGEFIDKLPEDAKQTVQGLSKSPPFKDYPFFKTTMENAPEFTAYSQQQINLLASQSEYIVNTYAEQFKKVFRPRE